jgi:hypothetical protein
MNTCKLRKIILKHISNKIPKSYNGSLGLSLVANLYTLELLGKYIVSLLAC